MFDEIFRPFVDLPHPVEEFDKKINSNEFVRAVIERRTPEEDNMIVDGKDSSPFNDANGDYPIVWSDENNHHDQGVRKKGGDGEGPDPPPPGDPKDMPNTVNPNPNIFGGFPENDIWGNFELPAPSTIDSLKMALKMNHHRPNYGGI